MCRKWVVGLVAILVVSSVFVSGYWWYNPPQQVEPVAMTTQEKKMRFKQLLVPVVEEVYADLVKQYTQVHSFVQDGSNGIKIAKLKKQYLVQTDAELLAALKPHPVSIALSQAAMESSWATSRFFVAGNNVFGVWSFDEHEERIAALKKRGNKVIWLKKYPTIKASIQDYYRTLGRGAAFSEFRQLKMVTDDPYALVTKLDRYSEKGAVYGQELAAIIRHNEFYLYDE